MKPLGKIFEKVRRRFNKINLRMVLFLVSAILSVVFLSAASVITYNKTVGVILNGIEKIDESRLRQIHNKLISSVGEIEKLTGIFSRNESLLQFLDVIYGDGDDLYGNYTARRQLQGFLISLIIGYEEISSIEIYTGDEVFSSSSGTEKTRYNVVFQDIMSSELYKRVKESKDSIVLVDPSYTDSVFSIPFGALTFASILRDGDREVGMLFVRTHNNWMRGIFDRESKISVIDKNTGSVIYSTNEDLSEESANVSHLLEYADGSILTGIGGESYKVFYLKTRYNDWYILDFNNVSDLSKPINDIKYYFIFAILISAVASLILTRIISGRVTRPIFRLIQTARKYRLLDRFERFIDADKRFSLKDTFMFYFIVIAVVPIMTYNIIFSIASGGIIEAKTKEAVMETMKQTVSNIDSFIEINERISANIMFDTSIQSYLIASLEKDGPHEKSLYGRVVNIIDNNLSLSADIFDAVLIGKKGEMLFSTSYFAEKSVDIKLLEYLSGSYMGNAVWTNYGKDRYDRNVIKLLRKINGTGDSTTYSMKNLGYFIATYYENSVEELYRDINIGEGSIFLVDENGTVMSHGSKSMIGQLSGHTSGLLPEASGSKLEYRNGKRFMIMYRKCTKIPWTLIGEFPYDEIAKDKRQIMETNIYIFVAALFIVLFVAYLISHSITKPLNSLNKSLAKLGDGELEISFETRTRINEIDELGRTFNDMAGRIRELVDRVYQTQIEKQEAELIALQAQINPHFLYNTLDVIKWTIKKGDGEHAVDMVTALGDLFRLSVSRGSQLGTVAEEISHAKAYINIQTLRLGDMADFHWSIDKSVLDCMTPKLVLQPMIENAIQHGIKDRARGGVISIFCFKENSEILFKVMDDGDGISRERLEEIRQALRRELSGDSIGIFNVQKRIQLYFGENYGITMDSQPGSGTIVTVRIPIIEDKRARLHS